MLLLSETSQAQLGATTREQAIGVYRHIAPVFAQFRGTTLPVAVLTTTALSTVNTIDNTTDMGVVTLTAANGTGRAVAGLGWQPASGTKKRHGVTRGRPPREPHRLGLQEKARLGPLEAANPATGIAAFLFGVKRQVAARQ
jgi:hypothetical protein